MSENSFWNSLALLVWAFQQIGQPLQHFQHKFTIDYEQNVFLMDSKPFRYVSGSFHYFRAVPEVWRDRLRTMRACGLNAVDTYIEWSLHNPKDGEYTFDGIADVEKFIQIAQEEDLYVILRPGPYICAERDNGGLPHWLFTKYPDIKPRTSDANYTSEVSIWYANIMKRMKPYLYGNGGPIIMVQVENEYGSFDACDKDYLRWLRDETNKYVRSGDAVLFTTDIPNDRISCGKIEDVFATTDFGLERASEIDDVWSTLRSVQPNGPLVNSEFYPGWLTHWQEGNERRDGAAVAEALRNILTYRANVNIYMFFGGTNFGFTAGANDWGFGNYTPDITSYDYDAVMDEAGDVTPKYMQVRDVLKEFMIMPAIEVPAKSPKTAYGSIQLKSMGDILSPAGLEALSVKQVTSKLPLSFEELDQYSGLVLYETVLPKIEIDPTILTVNKLHDRGLVYIDGQFIGTLSRQNKISSLPLNAGVIGEKLQILVENQGRINFNIANDTKGILGPVTIQKLNGSKIELLNWTSSSLPLKIEEISKFLEIQKNSANFSSEQQGILVNGPVVFYGELNIDENPTDTYLNTEGWGKGVAYINGFNLGRYWPLVGPQITMYVPGPVLRKGLNEIVLLEFQKTSSDLRINFSDVARLDGV
ncbi:beta-galactosidase isoform X2 [Episyrphus balteatus]|uniref:beta-galactosidase isoform X2 n=1 Tax=Episyrphus balteatus TaxID=286459 RepID=UPI00248686C0|nr:beta-galactosidase isoform X2 [Episyrphus balteatus]